MTFSAKYVGKAEGAVRAFGTTFEKGQAAEVEDKYRGKVAGNRFFEIAKAGQAKGDETGLKAEHHGGGRFNVTHGEEVLLKGLSKADADAFNAMSAEDKAEYVKAEQAKGD